MSFSWFTSNSPDSQPTQSKEPEGPSEAKDMTEGSQTVPSSEPTKPETEPASTAEETAPVVASASDPEKKNEDVQVPVSAPPASDGPPKAPPTSDPTSPRPAVTSTEIAATGATLKGDPAPNPDPGPLSEKGEVEEGEEGEEPEPTTTGGPPESGASAIDRQREFRRKRALKIHGRLARFFTWLLLFGFVLLPSTFERIDPNANSSNTQSPPKSRAVSTFACECMSALAGGGGTGASPNSGSVRNKGLLSLAYVCCAFNGAATIWLWNLRRNEYPWLLANLFGPNLINAFSGFLLTVVAAHGVKSSSLSSGNATIAVSATFTVVYALLCLFFYWKRSRARFQGARRSKASV